LRFVVTLENHGGVKFVSVGIIVVNFDDLRNEAPARPSFEMNDHIDGIPYVCLDGANAKVSPETTIATSDSPRAMVLVKACCKTFTAFSQGEFACAKAGAASTSANAAAAAVRVTRRSLRAKRKSFFMNCSSRAKQSESFRLP
jgi:hypothetical protein